MDFSLTEEQTIIVDMVRRFVREEILPLEMSLDPDADEVPPETLTQLTEKTMPFGILFLSKPLARRVVPPSLVKTTDPS